MKAEKQIEILYESLDKVLRNFSKEFDMPLATAIGVIETLKTNYINDAIKRINEEEED